MGLFDSLKKQASPRKEELGSSINIAEYLRHASPALRMGVASRFYEMYFDSVDLISKTVYCKTFFYRYNFALENAQRMLSLSNGKKDKAAAKGLYDILVKEKTNIVNDFLFRCYDAGKIRFVEKDIIAYMDEVPLESKKLLQMMLNNKDLEKSSFQRNACARLFAMLLSRR